ncbi:MAG: bifunctional DNA-binding transcriptional regulator/O6-methylguanine-DNA methyltransferase Ada [Sphingomicrobium sp.]
MTSIFSDAGTPDPEAAWAAFVARDRTRDDHFVGAVRTTGIYCKPSCPARRPKRENMEFYTSAREARVAGYRPCLRCRPDEVGRDRQAIAKAIELIEASDQSQRLEQLAAAVGYAPHHFQRLFTREIGVSPAAYARALRARRAERALQENATVTEAIYDAGFSGPSRFYASANERLGMTPSAWRDGGRGETIRWTIAQSPLGSMLVAATPKGVCRLSFEADDAALRRLFPNARIVEDDGSLTPWVKAAVEAIERPSAAVHVPLDVAGTAFQEAVWRELRKIPPGETRSYAEVAAAVGKPGAVRATGSANGANHVAVLIPCHRVVRSDGSLGGYAYGLDRKRKLLEAEASKAQVSLDLTATHAGSS